jgi:ComF family protein
LVIAIKEQIKKVYHLALNILLPPRCSGCGDPTIGIHIFCGKCWAKVNFIQKPCCHHCGAPMPYDTGSPTCVSCLTIVPSFDGGRSATRYDGMIRDIILKLKHGDATYLPPSLAGWLIQAGQDFWDKTDYIIPVPLHRWRLMRRRYNQATLLARAVSQRVNLPLLTNILIRSKLTESQGRKSRKERRQNVQTAFGLQDPKELLKGKRIVLIDDVWTTGATLAACTTTLKRGGVEKIYVLTLSRVVKE